MDEIVKVLDPTVPAGICGDRQIYVCRVINFLKIEIGFDRHNRLQDEKHVAKIAANFDIAYCQPLTLHYSITGLKIVDGQHRYRALCMISDNIEHPLHRQLQNWDICLDIHTAGEFRDLLGAFNNRLDFTEEQTTPNRAPMVIKRLNEELRMGGEMNGLYIRSSTNRPYLREEKMISVLQTSKFFSDRQNTVEDIVRKILSINIFLLRYLNTQTNRFWLPQTIRFSVSKNPHPNADIIRKLVSSKVALSTHTELLWAILLDNPLNKWAIL